MKRKILITLSIIFAVGVCVIGYTQATTKPSSDKAQQREQRHIEREQRRAERQAEYEKYINSIILARNYQFSPQSMQQEPAGPVRLLNNPNFGIQVWGSEVDIFLPYIKGVTPPYYTVMFNYTMPSVDRYITEQTQEGWLVTFASSLFSGSDYDFSLEIYTSSGSATLTISSPWYPDVQYIGGISGLN
ncbi:MAG: DUF4251 domain-containing protein [Alistipes sp.]|nr:DUF4251 domain-containing protein [Alistipes sp.]